jgi:hypothetical protein
LQLFQLARVERCWHTSRLTTSVLLARPPPALSLVTPAGRQLWYPQPATFSMHQPVRTNRYATRHIVVQCATLEFAAIFSHHDAAVTRCVAAAPCSWSHTSDAVSQTHTDGRGSAVV